MDRIGLSLSGCGFRATLYHLGVVRFLKDAGVFEHVSDIASVSGGSILAAHLVLNWDRYNGDDKRFDEAAAVTAKLPEPDGCHRASVQSVALFDGGGERPVRTKRKRDSKPRNQRTSNESGETEPRGHVLRRG